MALRTAGTTSTTALSAIIWTPSLSAADFAAIANSILDDYYQGTSLAPTPPAAPRIYPGAFAQGGATAMLHVPNRGRLLVKPGDMVAVDATGWPVLIGSNALTSGSTEWTHS